MKVLRYRNLKTFESRQGYGVQYCISVARSCPVYSSTYIHTRWPAVRNGNPCGTRTDAPSAAATGLHTSESAEVGSSQYYTSTPSEDSDGPRSPLDLTCVCVCRRNKQQQQQPWTWTWTHATRTPDAPVPSPNTPTPTTAARATQPAAFRFRFGQMVAQPHVRRHCGASHQPPLPLPAAGGYSYYYTAQQRFGPWNWNWIALGLGLGLDLQVPLLAPKSSPVKGGRQMGTELACLLQSEEYYQ